MTLAKVTCLACGWTSMKNCLLGYEVEREFYMNYRPECPLCQQDPGSWKIEEIIEVRLPLTENEKDLFSLAGGEP
ncbi:hypothetical protein DMB44_04370 [Thermoplasma sp. Kam2015]|uniref:hypothetical protein n=1 Tax=Thermoplasma sp. Kam2015 TaxID=2094122 RepID=UPI000D8DC3D6|nr:hypothetical protein [Thermoplasma sp. Kam2015]PYB68285.1 hypothetical protein DMB44_04370 [Thermoplasma sp. Kam2015]